MTAVESVVLFGSEQSLVGIVTDPPAAQRNRRAFVFLNAGFTHHVGPQRLHVQLARRLAELGYASLRFDYSGIGDSPRRGGAMSFAERAVQEARQALDLLEATRGVQEFVLFGLCWGADNAVRVAAADARVVGVVAVDFYAIMSTRYFLRFYARRLLNPRSWANIFGGRSAVWGKLRQLLGARRARRTVSAADGATPSADLLPVQQPAQIRAELDRLVHRGVSLLFCYAAVGGSYDRYVIDFREHMAELARRGGRVRVEVFRDADHVFTPLDSQEDLLAAVVEWSGAGHLLVERPAR